MGGGSMKYEFSKELKSLADIEELVENTSLLQSKEIRDHFELLLELRDELLEINHESHVVVETILEDISITAKEMTVLIANSFSKNKAHMPQVKKRQDN